MEASGPGDTSHDPAELTRLLAGGLQGENEERSPRYWAPLLILEIVEPSHELGAPIWLSVHHPEAGARHRGDDVASANFQLNAGIGHGFPLLRSEHVGQSSQYLGLQPLWISLAFSSEAHDEVC